MDTSQNTAEGGKPLTIKEKEKSEKLFEDYLNKNTIPFYRIDQEAHTKCNIFIKKNVRRPDYHIYLRNDDFYIDVKYREKHKFGSNEKRFYLEQEELNNLFNFQNEVQSIVWLAFTDNLLTPDFFYSPISEIYRFYINIKNEINKNKSDKIKLKFNKIGFIYIPEYFLYNHFSFNFGFTKEINSDIFNNEIKYHISNVDKIKNVNAVLRNKKHLKEYYKTYLNTDD
jgi:Holliday junction resolvase